MPNITVSATYGDVVVVREDRTTHSILAGNSELIAFNTDEVVYLCAESDEWPRSISFNGGTATSWLNYWAAEIQSTWTSIDLVCYETVNYTIEMNYDIPGEWHYFTDVDELYKFTLQGINSGAKKCLKQMTLVPGVTPLYGTNVFKINGTTQASYTFTLSQNSSLEMTRTLSSSYKYAFKENGFGYGSLIYINAWLYYSGQWNLWKQYVGETGVPNVPYPIKFTLSSNLTWDKIVLNGVEIEPNIFESGGVEYPELDFIADKYNTLTLHITQNTLDEEAKPLKAYRKSSSNFWQELDINTVEDTDPKTTIERNGYAVYKNGRTLYTLPIFEQYIREYDIDFSDIFIALSPVSADPASFMFGNSGDPYQLSYYEEETSNDDVEALLEIKYEDNLYYWRVTVDTVVGEWTSFFVRNNYINLAVFSDDFITGDTYRVLLEIDNQSDLDLIIEYYSEDWENYRLIIQEATSNVITYRKWPQYEYGLF